MFVLLIFFFMFWITTGSFWIAVGSVAFVFILFAVILKHVPKKRQEQIDNAKCWTFHSFDEFNRARQSSATFSGVYILKNLTLNKNYVGQSVDVYQRVAAHFMGRGNGDVYADYKYGNEFEIILVPLQQPWSSLNSMERYMIDRFNAKKGYNKTKGNRG